MSGCTSSGRRIERRRRDDPPHCVRTMIAQIESLFTPLAAATVASVSLAAWICWHCRSRWLCAAACANALLLYLPSTPLVANWALGTLEHRALALRRCGPPPAHSLIIVLAGGVHGHPAAPDDYQDLSQSSLRRVIAASRLALRSSGSTLVLSGGAGGRWREADLMAALARRLGVPAARIQEDRDSMTTYDSALNLRRMLAGNSHPRYLVTSAYHMPRAWMSFRHTGQAVCAWPVDFRAYPLEPLQMLMPQITALEKTGLALHEWAGMIVYRWFEFR